MKLLESERSTIIVPETWKSQAIPPEMSFPCRFSECGGFNVEITDYDIKILRRIPMRIQISALLFILQKNAMCMFDRNNQSASYHRPFETFDIPFKDLQNVIFLIIASHQQARKLS